MIFLLTNAVIQRLLLQSLAFSYIEVFVTNDRLKYALNIHKADISTMLKEMCINGHLEAEGHGRGTKYHLPSVDNVGSNVGSNVEASKRVN